LAADDALPPLRPGSRIHEPLPKIPITRRGTFKSARNALSKSSRVLAILFYLNSLPDIKHLLPGCHYRPQGGGNLPAG
jgi:hypothetical protein